MHMYMVRHGESYVNRDDWSTLSSLDTGLTDKGQQQAVALRNWLKQQSARADVLYCSTLRRACETAAIIGEALELEPILDDRLREIGTSYATGLPIQEEHLPRTFVDEWPHVAPYVSRTVELESVESWMHFRIRLAVFIEELARKHIDQHVYVVAHGGVIAATFDNIFNVGPYRRCEIQNDNTGWTHFQHRTLPGREPWFLWSHNRIDHLIDANIV